MKKLLPLALALTLCFSLTACGAVKNSEYFADGNGFYDTDVYYESPTDGKVEYEYASGVSVKKTSASTSEPTQVVEEKLVYTSYVSLETEDFESASASLHASIEKMGGIIVSENAYNLNGINHRGSRSLNLVVRIPQTNYDAFLSGLSEAYNVASVNNSVDNLTERYYDNENRLAAYRVQESRLLEMLGQAKSVSEMLEIESRLSEVQYSIEALTNTQRTIDNNVRYATFHLSLDEVTKYTTPAPKNFGERLSETVKESVEAFGNTLETFLFMLIYLAPHLAVIAVIVLIIVLCCKGAKRRRMAKAARVQAAQYPNAQNPNPQK